MKKEASKSNVLTLREKRISKILLAKILSCMEYDKENKFYTDNSNFTLALNKKEFEEVCNIIKKLNGK